MNTNTPDQQGGLPPHATMPEYDARGNLVVPGPTLATNSSTPPHEAAIAVGTPRTDAEEYQKGPCHGYPECDYVPADFARQLERELTAANERAVKAEGERDNLQHNLDSFLETHGWKCPWCSGQDTWFDRTITTDGQGNEVEGMKDRCSSCGKATDDLPTEKYLEERTQKLATQLTAVRAERDEAQHALESARKALETLVTRLHVVHKDERYLAVWMCYINHGGTYSGPFYVDELKAAETALAATAPGAGEGK